MFKHRDRHGMFSCSYVLRFLGVFVGVLNDTATTEIYTLSLHDALPISRKPARRHSGRRTPNRSGQAVADRLSAALSADRKSTRLNSSHANISYAVFCLKKKLNASEPQSLNASPLAALGAGSSSCPVRHA